MLRRQRVAAVSALASAVVLATALIVSARGSGEGAVFDAKSWRRPVPYCVKSVRGRMVDAVMNHELKMQMPMRSVSALLGPPNRKADDEWLYNVTREPSVTREGCVSLSLRTDGRTLRGKSLDRESG